MARTGPRTHSAPRSTLEKFSLTVLPPGVHRFLFSQSAEFVVSHLILRALFGAVSGTVLGLFVVHNLPPIFDLKLTAGFLLVAVCAMGGALSSSFRCSVLMMFPTMLGSRGHAYLTAFILSLLYKGPISNMHRNIETAALSLSCNLDLQVNNSKLLWRDAVKPFILITQELMDNKAEFEVELLNISRKFQSIRDEVVLQYGYDGSANANTSVFGVVEEGVQRCADWFRLRWDQCMEVVPVPVINYILCVSMKFHFLCDIMRVMTPWCTQQIPVEGNFGQLFDQLNGSFDQLSREFSAELVLQQQHEQDMLDGAEIGQEFSQAVTESFKKLTTQLEQLLNIFQLLMFFTFLLIFAQGCHYLRQYRRDIQFDNIYITTYFRQLDARRRQMGKCFLLPLNKSDRKRFVEPCSLKIHPEELKQVVSSGFQVLSVTVLCVILFTVDFSLFHVLDIVSRHTQTEFNLTSGHRVDITVDGASMMARLLRKMVSAFNSSSHVHIYSNNQACVSPPSSLPAAVYVSCVSCILLVTMLSCLQVYSNRLHRVIAAFYNPQREKKRVLFLYNLQLQRLKVPDQLRTKGQDGAWCLGRCGCCR